MDVFATEARIGNMASEVVLDSVMQDLPDVNVPGVPPLLVINVQLPSASPVLMSSAEDGPGYQVGVNFIVLSTCYVYLWLRDEVGDDYVTSVDHFRLQRGILREISRAFVHHSFGGGQIHVLYRERAHRAESRRGSLPEFSGHTLLIGTFVTKESRDKRQACNHGDCVRRTPSPVPCNGHL